jgi:hypothetical protein
VKIQMNNRRTIVVEGPLAFQMRRIAAARRGETGVQIMTIPQMAARLAGGFTRPAESRDLDPAIRDALEAGDFAELESIRRLPGMTRAVARTLAKISHADLPLERTDQSARLADIAEIERRVRANLPKGVLTPRALRDAALTRLKNAPDVLGPVELDGVTSVTPVWRPLLQVLNEVVSLAWRNAGETDISWFPGEIITDQRPTAGAMEVVSCANPRAEAVEALRWMRELIASGQAKPEEIAICATSMEEWDEHFLTLAADSDLPLHFSHGVPALASRDGQACAALADVLVNGLSQDRLRRLVGHAAAGDLPWDPTTPVEITGTNVRVKGSIDRLDLTASGNAVRVSDYKTGVEPKNADRIVLGGGAELQRVIYAMAARQLLPENPRIVARLIYLGDKEPRVYKLPDVDLAIAEIAAHVNAAGVLLRQGKALPGPDARESWNDFRLALPASPTVYFQVKQAALSRTFDDFAHVWSCL